MKRYLILIFILSVAIGLFLLRYTPESAFVEGVVGQPVNLNPAVGPRNEIDEVLEALLFRPLFKYDLSGYLTNDLAESYEIKDGERVYEIKIKEDAFWQDGYPITSDDVKFTFNQDPAFAKATIEVVAKKVIRFKLEDPLGSFLSFLTKPVAPSHLTGTASPFMVVGSGDFKVHRVSRNGEVKEIVLQNLGRGKIKKLIFTFFQTQTDLEEAARRGEIDAFTSDSFNHPSFTNYASPLYGRYFAIFFNLESKNKLAKDPTFREAAACKTPVTTLIDEVLKGRGGPLRGPMSGTWAEAKLPYPQFSSTLKENYQGEITLTVPDIGKLPEVAEIIAQNWKELGVEVAITRIEPTAIGETITAKSFEAMILGQEVERDPDRYNLWHSTQKDYPGLNITSYADPRADRALEEGRKTAQKAEREQHYFNFQQLFLEDTPAIFLYHPNFSYYVSRKFTGINLSSIFFPADRFWNVQEWSQRWY